MSDTPTELMSLAPDADVVPTAGTPVLLNGQASPQSEQEITYLFPVTIEVRNEAAEVDVDAIVETVLARLRMSVEAI